MIIPSSLGQLADELISVSNSFGSNVSINLLDIYAGYGV